MARILLRQALGPNSTPIAQLETELPTKLPGTRVINRGRSSLVLEGEEAQVAALRAIYPGCAVTTMPES